MNPATILPSFDLTKDPETLKQGSKQWKLTSQEIIQALNTHGYLLVKYDAISNDDRQRLYEAMHRLFSLPPETKRRSATVNDTRSMYRGGYSFVPLYESFTVTDASHRENVEAFTKLMWPEGNDEICDVMSSMSTKLMELNWVLLNLIFDGLGLPKQLHESLIATTNAPFTVNKYLAPEKDEPVIGIQEHADLGYLTILGQNQVPGLRIKNNKGEWFEVDPGESHYVIFIGQSLRAMTNGRLKATFHEVNLNQVKDRLSFASFLGPKPDQTVDVLPEMVDDEHPRLFRSFPYGEFAKSVPGGVDTLPPFAGI